jgi:hypothetical protein
MEINKVNDIDTNWVLVSITYNKRRWELMRRIGNYPKGISSIDGLYIALYADIEFLKTLKSIRDFKSSNSNYVISGKIILLPEERSFTLSLICGEFSDMVDLIKDPLNEEKRSKVRLINKRPSNYRVSVEYDMEKGSLCFEYEDRTVDPLISDEFELGKLIEMLENKLENGNSKLQD